VLDSTVEEEEVRERLAPVEKVVVVGSRWRKPEEILLAKFRLYATVPGALLPRRESAKTTSARRVIFTNSIGYNFYFKLFPNQAD
jgi:hypothetical protein